MRIEEDVLITDSGCEVFSKVCIYDICGRVKLRKIWIEKERKKGGEGEGGPHFTLVHTNCTTLQVPRTVEEIEKLMSTR